MRSIGIRELRQHASKYLRLVREGETIEVTDRGEPIAMITPAKSRDESAYDRLVREGKIIPARVIGRLSDIEPIPLKPGERAPSEELIEERESDWR
jgi:prevent-host-death family protein